MFDGTNYPLHVYDTLFIKIQKQFKYAYTKNKVFIRDYSSLQKYSYVVYIESLLKIVIQK